MYSVRIIHMYFYSYQFTLVIQSLDLCLARFYAEPIHGAVFTVQALYLQMIHKNTNKELHQQYFIPKAE